jgi:hypothetical protein
MVKIRVSSSLPFLFFCGTVFGQSGLPATLPATFHVTGTISVLASITAPAGFLSQGIPGAEVRFHSAQGSMTVVADGAGVYQADLPVGVYTMTARFPGHPAIGEYRRPAFRAPPGRTITLNGNLYVERGTCDLVLLYKPGEAMDHSPSREQESEAIKDNCGSEDFWTIPSKNGLSLELYVRYEKRSHAESTWTYDSGSVAINHENPVVVECDLLTLRAKQVIYDAQHGTLEATGAVAIENGSGVTETADRLTLKIQDIQNNLLQSK